MSDELIVPEQNVTEVKPFEPNVDQLKWLEAAIQLETDTITEIAAGCGIDRKQWYRWIEKPEFVDWYDREYNQRLKAHRWRLNAIGMKNAKRDHRYWQDMQRITGNLKEEKNTNIQVNVTPILGGATKK